MKEVSEEFLAVFPGCGSPVLQCACGRTHVAEESPDLDPHVKKTFRERAPFTDPKVQSFAVVLHSADSITAREIAGIVIVDGCYCGQAARFQEIFDNERENILRYYRLTAVTAMRNADSLLKSLDSLDALSSLSALGSLAIRGDS